MNCNTNDSAPETDSAPDLLPHARSPRALEADRLIGRKELCRFLGVSYTTVWSWLRSEKFVPAFDVNGIPKWRLSDVRAWVDARPRRAVKPLSLASEQVRNGTAQVEGDQIKAKVTAHIGRK